MDETPESVERTRLQLLELRRAALRDLEVYWALQLSDAIVYLAQYRARLEADHASDRGTQ